MDHIPTEEERAIKADVIRRKWEKLSEEKFLKLKVKADGKKIRKKLHDIEQKNETLAKTISDKNLEISALKRSVDSLNDVLNSVPIDELRCNSSIASNKILELSKKNRHIRAELEQMKNRLNKKDVQIEKLERELKSNEEKQQDTVELMKKANVTDELQAKISSMQQKFFETRNKNLELQNQLKMAQKCLEQEIGESFSVNLITNTLNHSSWRGRAQQILALQQKVQELKARLEAYETRFSDRGDYAPIPMGVGIGNVDLSNSKQMPPRAKGGNGANSPIPSVASGDGAGGASFDRFTPNVRKSEILHKAKVDTLEKEIVALQSSLEEQRSKTLALKVRNKTLNDEVIKYKLRCTERDEQTDYNGINISTLSDKLKTQRHQYESRLDDLRLDLVRITEERDTARRQMEELSSMNIELETKMKQKEGYIETLQDMIKNLETDLRAVTGGFLFSCREFRKEEFVGILDALEVEKNQLMLLNKTLNERLDTERQKCETNSELMGKQKIRIARLEAKIRELEKEQDAMTDRKKRSQRIADYASTLSRSSINGSIASFTFENQSQYQSATSLNSTATPLFEPKVEDLKNQLELANEKITMLTEKVNYLSEEKRIDAKFFEETLVNSKTIILDTILNARDGTTTSVNEMPATITNTIE